MCGLAGYTGTHDPELLHRMSQIMAYRGPDDHGIWHDRQHGVGLAHRRLSIIDLSAAGQQPMASDDGSIVIAYNGEVYDFQEHRRNSALISRSVCRRASLSSSSPQRTECNV